MFDCIFNVVNKNNKLNAEQYYSKKYFNNKKININKINQILLSKYNIYYLKNDKKILYNKIKVNGRNILLNRINNEWFNIIKEGDNYDNSIIIDVEKDKYFTLNLINSNDTIRYPSIQINTINSIQHLPNKLNFTAYNLKNIIIDDNYEKIFHDYIYSEITNFLKNDNWKLIFNFSFNFFIDKDFDINKRLIIIVITHFVSEPNRNDEGFNIYIHDIEVYDWISFILSYYIIFRVRSYYYTEELKLDKIKIEYNDERLCFMFHNKK